MKREITKGVLNVHNLAPEVVDDSEAHVSTTSFSSIIYHGVLMLNFRSRTTYVIRTFSLLGLILSGLFSLVFRLGSGF